MIGTRSIYQTRGTNPTSAVDGRMSVLSDDARTTLEEILEYNNGEINSENIQEAYLYLVSLIEQSDGIVHSSVITWVTEAQKINAGEGGRSATFIRLYNNHNEALDGNYLTVSEQDEISDRIAESFFTGIIQGNGVIPTIAEIASRDAGIAMAIMGNGWAGWGGSFYYWNLPALERNEAGDFVAITENGDPEDYLTIGEIIARDPEQRSRFINNMSQTLDDMDGVWEVLSLEVYTGGQWPVLLPSLSKIGEGLSTLSVLCDLPDDILEEILTNLEASGSIIPGLIPEYSGYPAYTIPTLFNSAEGMDLAAFRLFAFRSAIAAAEDRYKALYDDRITTIDLIQASGIVGENLWDLDASQILANLGSVLGRRITDNEFGQLTASAAFKSILGELGEVVDGLATGMGLEKALDSIFDDLGSSFKSNIVSGGIGAISSYLTAELFDALGIDGTVGELGQTLTDSYVSAIIDSLPDLLKNAGTEGAKTLSDVLNGVQIWNVVGSFIGKKLASEIYSFETVGGQIGAAVGGLNGGIAGANILAGLAASGNPALAALAVNPVVAVAIVAIAVIVHTLLGGFIGSLFGGTPRSGADTVWSAEEGRFVVANVYSRKGGNEDAARNFATSVAGNLNAVLIASGSALLNPAAIQTGNYGMRKSAFVYRPVSTREKEAITARFEGEDAALNLVRHGTYLALNDTIGQLAGGNIYVKRAVATSLALSNGNASSNLAGAAGDFDVEGLLGNLLVAQDYSNFLANHQSISELISAETESTFASGWLVTLTRAQELGLNKRSQYDWNGGFETFLDEVSDGFVNGAATSVANIQSFYSEEEGRYWAVYDIDRELIGFSWDALLAGDITTVEGTELGDTIVISMTAETLDGEARFGGLGRIENATGLIVNGEQGGEFVDVPVSATVFAGAGDDLVRASDLGDTIFGEAGSDTLYGGRLDDWLMGGEGSDRLDAGSASASTLGGDGNYLSGGAGDDQLFGREGSDWLEGGEGVDVLRAGEAGDILTGGATDNDLLYGGAGDDSYLLRLGDGADIVSDTDDAALQMDAGISAGVLDQFSASYRNRITGWFDQADTFGSANYVDARFGGMLDGTVERDWLGYLTPGIRGGSLGGGEDSVALGQGIGLGDVRLRRSGDDLLIEITAVDPDTGVESDTGDMFTLTNWFTNPFERIEWLKFADGNEIRIGDFTSFVAGTNDADTLIGTLGNDFVYGGGGNDDLFLLAGDDIGSGGTGRDMVAGDAGADIVVGGSEEDLLLGGGGDDLMSGDAGDDEIHGGDGSDIVSGGRGDDLVVGGAGNDIFKFNRGDGRDTVVDELSNGWEDVWTRTSGNGAWAAGYTLLANGEVTAPDGSIVRENLGTTENPDFRWVGLWDYNSETQVLRRHVPPAEGAPQMRDVGEDTVEFGLDIRIQDIVLSREGDDLLMSVGREEMVSSEGVDGLRFASWFDGLTGPAASPIEALSFYSTGRLDLTTTTLGVGTSGNDTLTGVMGADWMTGAEGEDVIDGQAGDDILSGNGGSDTLIGGLGVDVLYGGSGDDWLRGGAGRNPLNNTEGDILSGGSGSDWASYLDSTTGLTVSLVDPGRSTGWARNDVFSSIENLEGSSFGDWLTGDAYDNILAGRQGNDTLTGREGDDTYLWEVGSNGHHGADIIREGGDGVDVVVDAAGNLAAGYVQGWVSRWEPREPEVGEPEYPTPTVRDYDDDVEYRRWAIWAVGSNPSAGPLDPSAEAGPYIYWDDTEYTESDSEFYSSTRPSPFEASNWSSGYIQAADGTVTTAGIDATVDGGLDTLELGEGITLADLTFFKSGNNLIVRYGASTASQITIENHYLANGTIRGGAVETLQFHQGLSVNLDQIRFQNGSSNDDFVVKTDAAETVNGFGGDDTIWGDGGDDAIYGDGGDDVLEGGAGADTLVGGGHSLAADNATGWGDTLSYFSSVGATITVDFRQQGTGVAQLGGDAQGDIISEFENYLGSNVDRDIFYGDDNDNRAFGNGGNDTLRGYGGNDVLVGGAGVDNMYGGLGDDNIAGDQGNDYLQGDGGNDILAGGEGDDRLQGRDGNDHLIGGDGDDFEMLGGDGDDVIDGGAGADTILGGLGADTILGGEGADALSGEGGDDTYYVGAQDGADVIVDTDGVNSIVFAPGITRDRVWLSRSGNDLTVSVIGGTSSATFKDFYSGIGRLEKIQTQDGTLFVNTPEVQEMIRQMSGGFAAAANMLDLSDWPRMGQNLPADGGPIDGWHTSYIGETEWAVTQGPNGGEVVSLHAGQEDANNGSGGGALSDGFTIDGSKGYEFTVYVKNDGDALHNLYFGTVGGVKRAADGVAASSGYFVGLSPAAQSQLEQGKWYKVVGYVLPEGSANVATGELGGVFDAETGEKVRDVTNFRWDENRSSNEAKARFFNFYETEIGYNTHFYRPEVRELGTEAAPPAMPSWFADRLDSYWEPGDTPAPRAPLEPQRIELINYGANLVIEDFWPDAVGGRGDNLLNDNGWPTDVDAPPPAATPIAGWAASYSSEIQWVSTDGPYGQGVVSLHTGQLGTDAAAGGAVSHDVTIDKNKSYEFSVYFKVDEESIHRINFGLIGDVVNGADGAANTNPYFTTGLQNAGTGVEAGKWYKMVGYVLPDGSVTAPSGTYGGIYDVETGEKVRDIDHFAWDAAGTSNSAQFRFLTRDADAQAGFYSHFVRPQMNEISAGAMLTGDRELDVFSDSLAVLAPNIPGWRNWAAYALDGEARWTETAGPDGQPMSVLETGQFDAGAESGGQLSNDFPIDGSKTYRFVQYVRKSDMAMHSLYAGIRGTPGLLENAVTGATTHYGWMLGLSGTQLDAAIEEDKWYKVVGYVLPEGSANVAAGSLGGVYDAQTGQRVASVDTYRWGVNRTDDTAYTAFQTPHDTDQFGWSAQWAMPEFTAITSAELAADNADPFGAGANDRNDGSAVLIDASLGVTDADGDILAYELNPDGTPSMGRIEILNAATGQIRYTPDVGATGSDSFSVLVRDAAGNATVVPLEVEILPASINRAPEVPETGFSVTIAENSAAGALAGTLTTTDPEGDLASGFDYLFEGSLVSYVGGRYVTFSQDGRFRLERDTGIVRANDAMGDFETDENGFEYGILVRDRNGGLNSRSAHTTLRVELDDVNEVHTLNAASIEVNYYSNALGPFIPMPDTEGHAIDIRELMLVDPEIANMAWAIISGAGPFGIDQDGTLRLLGAIAAGQSYTLSVTATDALARVQTATLTISVGNTDGGTIDITGGGGGVSPYDPDYDPYYWDRRSPEEFQQLPPIVLDLDGDGVELVSIATSEVYFDMDGDGTRDLTGWVGADDGLLVYDANDDGIVNDGSEISFQQYVDGAFSDLEGLAHFDTDEDGSLGVDDAEFARFHVWTDADQDGVTDVGELVSLDERGIVSISLSGSLTGQSPNGSDNTIYATGSYRLEDGGAGILGDTFLVFDPMRNPDDDDDGGVVLPPDDDDDAEFSPARLSFDRKSKKFRAYSLNGELAITMREADGAMDPRAGTAGAFSEMRFSNRSYGYLDAIVLDLDGDGIETKGYWANDARFDMNGDGITDNTGWTTSRDGMLVIDRNENGRIDDGSELSFAADAFGARSSMQGLSAFDINRDGLISSLDSRFGELKIWVDANHNGRNDQGELRTLAQQGIASISIRAAAYQETDKVGHNVLLSTAIFNRTNGATGTLGNVAFGFEPSRRPVTGPNAGELQQNDHWMDDRFPRIGELSLHDILRDDFFTRFDSSRPMMRERLENWLEEHGETPFNPVEPAGILPNGAQVPSLAEAVHVFEGAGVPQEAAQARILALMMQDMAAFGARGALDETLRDRRQPYMVADFYA